MTMGELAPLHEPPSTPSQQLCVRCGLCCQGVWFTNISSNAEEVEPGKAAGFVPIVENGNHFFRQPCSFHVNGCCSAYGQWRPAACVTYKCGLLGKLEDGSIEFAQACEHVDEAKRLATELRANMPEFNGLFSEESRARMVASSSSSASGEYAIPPRVRLLFVSLIVYFRKHFANRDA